MAILTQFVLRLSFGLAASMAITSPRQVTSGYYRNHLYVLLGLNALAALVAIPSHGQLPIWPPAVAAMLAYVGSVIWLYEKPKAGRIALVVLALVDLTAALWAAGPMSGARAFSLHSLFSLLDAVTGGLVLGVTIASMFLGHWYLNSPTMELAPLQRLVRLLVAVLLLRAAACGVGLAFQVSAGGPPGMTMAWLLVLRWLSGIAAPLLLAWMTLRTLEDPNTQSATGILYVAVITTFTGELCGLLLSSRGLFPL